MKRAKKKQLTLEDYLSLFDNLHSGDLTVDHLRQILSIHGCCRRRAKDEVMEDLRTLQMMSPRRSTLGNRAAVYPCAPLTLDEVKADVSSVGWEECPLGSIIAVGSAAEKEAEAAAAASTELSRPASTTTASSSAPEAEKQKGIKRKRRAKTVAITASSPSDLLTWLPATSDTVAA